MRYHKNTGRRVLALAAIALGAGLNIPAVAQSAPAPAAAASVGAANINITPRRVIFDRNKRTEAVYLFNQGNAAITVDIALVDNAMLPSGEIVPLSRIAEKGPDAAAVAARVKSAKPMLLAAPSRLVLGPGQGKTVRVRAQLPDEAQGEYRTHLTVTSVPPPDTGLTAEQAAAAQRGELVLRIQSIFGLSIPLIVRPGATDAAAAFGAVRLGSDGGKPVLDIEMRRSGSNSVYGNIEVRSGKEVVGMIRGLGIYPEITQRAVRVPLTRPLRKGETLGLVYAADDNGKNGNLAAGSFTAP